MKIEAKSISAQGTSLDATSIRQTLEKGLAGRFTGAKVLALIPDHTRTIPLDQLFPMVVEVLADTRQLDFMVALGTHPPLDESRICQLVDISMAERRSKYRHIGLLNHAWDSAEALIQIGTLPQEKIQQLAANAWHPTLGGDVPVRINRCILEYDQIIIIGPTFPHEIAGFSGGAKYLFPGISGPEMIDVSHWLAALVGGMETIGLKDTPVRAMLHAAAKTVPTPVELVALVAEGEGLAGLFIGDLEDAWRAAADLSSERHIQWLESPYRRVLSWAPAMYDEFWTGAKAMYKLEPAIADGGEVIIYAPHLRAISHVHGRYIQKAGYHVKDYFLKEWGRVADVPLAVLAHCVLARGAGSYEDHIERPRIQVTLASQISAADCASLCLGYMDPAAINPDAWRGREDEGILFVPKAGEMLYRVK